MGYYLDEMNYQLWKYKLKYYASENRNQEQLQKAMLLSDSLEDIFRFSSSNYCIDTIKNEIKQNKIEQPKVEKQLLIKYIEYFIKKGIFPAPKL